MTEQTNDSPVAHVCSGYCPEHGGRVGNKFIGGNVDMNYADEFNQVSVRIVDKLGDEGTAEGCMSCGTTEAWGRSYPGKGKLPWDNEDGLGWLCPECTYADSVDSTHEWWTVAEVTQIPECDYCNEPAVYDATMKDEPNANANFCSMHFVTKSTQKLGMGHGQRYVLIDNNAEREKEGVAGWILYPIEKPREEWDVNAYRYWYEVSESVAAESAYRLREEIFDLKRQRDQLQGKLDDLRAAIEGLHWNAIGD